MKRVLILAAIAVTVVIFGVRAQRVESPSSSGGGGSMVYPGAGVPESTGSAWGSSLALVLTVGPTGLDTALPSEKAIRSAITTAIATVTTTSIGAVATSALDTDTSLTANSDSKIATQKATKAYVDAHAIGSLSWTGLVYSNSWVDFGSGLQAGQWAKDGYGVVRLRGILKAGGTCSSSTTIFTLPSGARPATATIAAILYDNTNYESVNIGTDGVISLRETLSGCTSSDYVSLEGITFSTN